MSEQITRTIVAVKTEPRIWGDDKGHGRPAEVGVKLATQDGEEEVGEYRSTENDWQKVVARISEHLGESFTFTAEKPKKEIHNGVRQWRLKDYPGKPAQREGGSGGGGGRGNTPEDRASMNASTAVKVASALVIRANEAKESTADALAADLERITPAVVRALAVAMKSLGGGVADKGLDTQSEAAPDATTQAALRAVSETFVDADRAGALETLRAHFSSAEALLDAVLQLTGTLFPSVDDVPIDALKEVVTALDSAAATA